MLKVSTSAVPNEPFLLKAALMQHRPRHCFVSWADSEPEFLFLVIPKII